MFSPCRRERLCKLPDRQPERHGFAFFLRAIGAGRVGLKSGAVRNYAQKYGPIYLTGTNDR
jgi:hypothetical protein